MDFVFSILTMILTLSIRSGECGYMAHKTTFYGADTYPKICIPLNCGKPEPRILTTTLSGIYPINGGPS